MNYSVVAVPTFKKEIKKLSKRYPSVKTEFANLIASLEAEPQQGTSIGKNCYKIRFAIASKGKGKRGGARIIINVTVTKTTVYLLSIYDKSVKESVTDKELQELLLSIQE